MDIINPVTGAVTAGSVGTALGGTVASGTWTPVLTFSTPGNLAVTYNRQFGSYVKIGKLVHVNFGVITSAFTHTSASGTLRITGLPFTASNSNAVNTNYGNLVWQGITKVGYTDINTYVVANTSYIEFGAAGSGVLQGSVGFGDTPTAGTVALLGTIIYQVDA